MPTIMRVGGGAGGGKPKGKPITTLAEKDVIIIYENGLPVEYYIAKHGYEPELNTNRTLLVRKECNGIHSWNNPGPNSYDGSELDVYFNTEVFSSYSAGVQALIGKTKFVYTLGNNNSTMGTLERAVFTLSLAELGLSYSGANAEGTALPIASTLKIATYNGTAVDQWVRTPQNGNNNRVPYVRSDGGVSLGYYSSGSVYSRSVVSVPSDSIIIDPDEDGIYELEAETVSEVYGICRDITAQSSEWARTDTARKFMAVASVGVAAGYSDFDNIYPWSEMKRVTLDSGDVMVRIPKFYYGRYRNGDIERIQISGRADVGLTLHPAFNHGGVEADAIYVGAYKTSSNNKSVSGASPTTTQALATFRTNARAKGNGWHLIDISTISAIQMLYLVEFAHNNSQQTVGRGYCDGNSAAINTGSCDTVPNLTGRPTGTDGKTDVVYRGIEGLWGNVWEWVDGIAIGGYTYHITNDPSKYDTDVSAYPSLSYSAAAWNNIYIAALGFDEAYPYIMLPNDAGASETTYYCDTTSLTASGWKAYIYGGLWSGGSQNGLFANQMKVGSSEKHASIGSRLIYIP